MPHFDFIVAGAGLAGACAARRLADHGSVLVFEKEAPASGGSSVAAGLVNPILGLRARPVWRIEEAVAALDETVVLADAESAYRRRPTLRPAADEQQVAWFKETAETHPHHCTWVGDPGFEWLRTPLGALRIETGGMIDLDSLIRCLLAGIELRHDALTAWEETDHGVTAHVLRSRDGRRAETITARRLILALGRGYTSFPEMMRLRLHQIKGQTIRMSRPPSLPDDAPHLAGSGYVASENGTVVCGSTYEHRFTDLTPSARATRSIIQKIEGMFPGIADAKVLEQRAGVRVTVPGIRLPMIGPLPEHRHVWIFTGLGAKGLLTAPLVAKELPGYLEDAERIPKQTRVRLA